MKPAFLAGVAVVPGVLSALATLPWYDRNPVSGRYTHFAVDRKQGKRYIERALARRLMASWGERMKRQHREVVSGELRTLLETEYEKVKQRYQYRLPGTVHLLDSESLFTYMLPTGDFFVSTSALKSLSASEIQHLVAHELSHMHLRHQQERLGYSHIIAQIVAWLHRANHHTTERIGDYLVAEGSWSALQEREAREYARTLVGEMPQEPLCLRGIQAAAELTHSRT